MAARIDELIGHLNDLIETCKDGEKGFRVAAQFLEERGDPELRSVFATYAQQRARFAAELQNEVLGRGRSPARAGHVSAIFHRGWMTLRAAVNGQDEASLIAACENGEQAAMRNYENVLKQNLPTDVLAIAEHHYAEIRLAHDRILSLQRAYRAG